nr:hypothetical protein GCM10020093_115720 [Planobispora longispora]
MTSTTMTMTSTADLTKLVRESLDDPLAEIAQRHVEPVVYASGSLSTAGLHRVRGTTTDGRPWSFFVKSIHSARHWPLPRRCRRPSGRSSSRVSPGGRTRTCTWPLPAARRAPAPRLHRIDDLGDDRLVLWLEDVQTVSAGWDLDRYRRAARLLGALAAMRPVAATPDTPPDSGMRLYCAGAVQYFLSILRDSATWRHPLVAAYADDLLRADLLALADRIGPLLAAVERLPHALAHGDASPQNLLVPADGSAEFVAVDWSWGSPTAVGFDLGQLLVGLAHAGVTDPRSCPRSTPPSNPPTPPRWTRTPRRSPSATRPRSSCAARGPRCPSTTWTPSPPRTARDLPQARGPGPLHRRHRPLPGRLISAAMTAAVGPAASPIRARA